MWYFHENIILSTNKLFECWKLVFEIVYGRKGILMSTEQLYRLVEDFFGYKCHMRGLDSEKKKVFCVLYDSFWLECDLDDRYGMFGIGIKIGKEEMITEFLGESCFLNSDKKSIKESLRIVDNYCRLRLPDKFLDAYYEAYVTSLYDNEDCRGLIGKFIERRKK